MSILYMDGFEQYDTAADLVLPYAASNLTTVFDLQTDTPLGRGKSLRSLQPAVNHSGLTRALNTSVPLGTYVGQAAWVKFTTFPYDSSSRFLFGFLEGTTMHAAVSVGADGALNPSRGTYGLGPGTSRQLELNRWYHIEARVRIHDSIGSIAVRVDGELWGVWNDVDTRSGANGICNAVRAIYTNTATAGRQGIVLFDNWAVWDESGTENNDWIGSVEVLTLRPADDDNAGTWTANTGDPWEALDELGSDGDTTYIASSTPNDAATFVLSSPDAAPEKIIAIQSMVIARKDDSGSRAIKHGVSINGEDGLSADTNLGTSYTAFHHVIERNPDTEDRWAAADLADLKSKVVVSV